MGRDEHSGVMVAAERDGVRVELRLPTDTYLAGEVFEADVVVRNVGAEVVLLTGAYLTVRDEQGQRADTGGFWRAEWYMFGPVECYDLAPGESFRRTPLWRVPREGADRHRYSAWAGTGILCQEAQPDGGLALESGHVLEAGPIPLRVTQPAPAQRLRAELRADRQGWRLRVTDGLGGPVAGPFWGERIESSSHGMRAGGLGPSADGTWADAWPGHLFGGGVPVTLGVWVGAPGYVSVNAGTEVAGTPS